MKKPKLTLLTLIIASQATPVFAEDKLEEVIVTAQKRAETLGEVPLSVQVFNADFLKEMGVKKVEDLVNISTNFHYTETGLSTQVRIRGIGSGNSQGFEQSVGQYVDGVYYGRAPLFRSAIYDVQQVEILKGSQNAQFGKDSIAGALSIKTAEPTESFYGKLTAGYTPQSNQKLGELNISGPLTPDLSARLTLRKLDEDGYMRNTTQNHDDPGRNETNARLKLNWNVTDSFTLKTKLETNTFDVTGRPYEIVQDLPSKTTLNLIAKQPNNTVLAETPSTFSNILAVLFKQPAFESNMDFNRQTALNEYSNNNNKNFTTEGIWSLDKLEVHTTLAQIKYNYDELCECDYVPANIFTLSLDENFKQNSFDTYIKNTDDKTINWLAGVSYQTARLNFHDRFFVPGDTALKALVPALPGTGVNRLFNQDDANTAVYGEISFAVDDKTTLQIDGRYTHDQKDASRSLTIIDKDDQPINKAAVTCTYLAGLKVETVQSLGMPFNCSSATPNMSNLSKGNSQSDDSSENVFTPSATLSYQVADKQTIFGSVKTGHKSGGFDPRSNSYSSFKFSEEKSTSEELGWKFLNETKTWDNNIVAFHTTYDNLQVSQFDGGLGFNVGNAKATTAKGLELDGRVQATADLQLSYDLGLIDIKYDDFKNGNCYQGQTPDGIDSNGDGKPDLCDYSGKRVGFTPRHTLNVGANYTKNWFGGETIFSINIERVGEANIHENQDPRGIQPAYNMVNASVSYKIDNIDFSIVGNNLTNEYVKTYSSNVPLSGSFFGTNTLYAFSKRPRSIAVTASIEF